MHVHVMSSDKIVTVENLSKKYPLRHQGNEHYIRLRDVLIDRAKNLFQRNGNKALTSEDFWALKEENYDEATYEK
jgi:homopolymeric O-antigen transport system ATP-binding protein